MHTEKTAHKDAEDRYADKDVLPAKFSSATWNTCPMPTEITVMMANAPKVPVNTVALSRR